MWDWQLSINYLGIPIHYRRLTLLQWKIVEKILQKRLSSWKGKLLSLGGRLILINSVLTNMVRYMISFLQQSWIDYFQSRFFWQGDSEQKKYQLTKWSILRRPRDQGGEQGHAIKMVGPGC
jgi:hypothetical protein